MDFQTLMAQATAVAKRQDAALAERARQRLREEDEQRRKEEKQRQAREEQQQMLASVREDSERRQQKQLQEKRQQRQAERQKATKGKTKSSARKTVPGGDGHASNILASARLGGKRDAQLSFDELMAKAKAIPVTKSAATSSSRNNSNAAAHASSSSAGSMTRPTLSGKRPPPSSSSSSLTPTTFSHTQHHQQQQRNTPALFHKKRPPPHSSTASKTPATIPSAISTKDRIRQMYHGPPQKINATKKRDARSISEIHRDIRHSRGTYSDDEDSRADPRLIRNKQMRAVAAAARSPSVPSQYQKSRPVDPAARPRMPFQRPAEKMRRAMPQKRSYDEVDEELESFIVDDEEDENDYSAEISRIFRYNKSKYADDMYSDDDMEADAREVLREERRSERIGRREDIEEEKKELERLKRLKLKGKSRA